MATPIACCTASDIIARFGGQDEVNKALDPNRTGTYDTNVLNLAVIDASADVEAAVGERYKIWGATEFPHKIVRLAATLGIYYTWFYATGGRAIPPEVVQLYKDTSAELVRIEKGEGSPGSPRPASRLYPRTIDNSDGYNRMTYLTSRYSGRLGSR